MIQKKCGLGKVNSSSNSTVVLSSITKQCHMTYKTGRLCFFWLFPHMLLKYYTGQYTSVYKKYVYIKHLIN